MKKLLAILSVAGLLASLAPQAFAAHAAMPSNIVLLLNGKRVPKGTKGARKVTKQSSKYYACWREGKKQVRVPLATDYEASQVMLADLPIIPVVEAVDWYQYSTQHHTGWPTPGNPYAQPSAYAFPDMEQVLRWQTECLDQRPMLVLGHRPQIGADAVGCRRDARQRHIECCRQLATAEFADGEEVLLLTNRSGQICLKEGDALLGVPFRMMNDRQVVKSADRRQVARHRDVIRLVIEVEFPRTQQRTVVKPDEPVADGAGQMGCQPPGSGQPPAPSG